MFDSSYTRFPYFLRQIKQPFQYFLVILIGCFSLVSQAMDIRLGTAENGSFSHFSGKAVCRIINKHAGKLHCKAVVVQGINPTDNLSNIQNGSLDLAIVDSSTLYDAINKKGNFTFLDIDYSNLRVVMPMYDLPVTLVVRGDAGIKYWSDLVGKRINIGSPRSPEQLMMKNIMAQKNWTRQDFSLVEELSATLSQDTLALCNGQIQSTLHIGVHPNAKLEQLLTLCGAKFASINDQNISALIESNPALSRVFLTRDLYPEIDRNIQTLGQTATLITSDALDDETVQQILSALKQGGEQLSRSHPALSGMMSFKPQADSNSVSLHPASKRFFQ